MRKALLTAWVTLLLLPAALEVPAQPLDRPPREVEILSLDALRDDLYTPSIRDLRPEEDYLEGHIPGAHHLDWHPLQEAALTAPGPAMDRVVEALGDARLMPGQAVVLYDTSLMGRADGWTAWLLAYAGLKPVFVFDGGFAAWNRRRRLGVFRGPPIPSGRRTLRAEHLEPRPDLRVDPATLEDGVPAGSAVLVVDPVGDTEPGPGHVQPKEVLDERGAFLYPYHLRLLLEAREMDPEARLLLRGSPLDVGLVWTALVANGFDAAVVIELTEDTAAKQAN